MKEKYITDTVGKYYLLRESDIDSSILTSKNNDDIANSIPTDVAERIARDRNTLVDALVIAISENGDNAYSVLEKIRSRLYT